MSETRFAFAIDKTTNDLYLGSDGDLETVTDAEAVGQHARARLQTYYAEWYLDTTCGLPWLDSILGKGYDSALAESVVKSSLLETSGVTGATDFNVSFDKSTRGLIIKEINVTTIFDEDATV